MRDSFVAAKMKASVNYTQNVYAALCNRKWRKLEVWAILQDDAEWACTWRYAGGLVAEIHNGSGDYMDWYCSGYNEDEGYVNEGTVTQEVEADLHLIGWVLVTDE